MDLRQQYFFRLTTKDDAPGEIAGLTFEYATPFSVPGHHGYVVIDGSMDSPDEFPAVSLLTVREEDVLEADPAIIGRYGVCSLNRVGKIDGYGELPWGMSFFGTGVDGRPWASREPRLLPEAWMPGRDAA